MQRILIGLLLFALCMLLFFAWQTSSSDYISQQMKEQFTPTVASVTGKSSPETTEAPETTTVSETTEAPATTAAPVAAVASDTVLVFAGDVNLDVNYNALVPEAVNSPASCIEDNLLEILAAADVFMAGNVFAITNSTDELQKQYNFRTAPENAVFWSKIGADILSVANNHTFDYGTGGFTDTVSALGAEGIVTVGAGQTLAEASAVHYVEVNGKCIAFTAAMRSEKYVKTPAATETEAGVMKMYDIEPYLEVVRTADANADLVIAYVHWGTENTNHLEAAQTDGAKALIDAGADVVVGAHTHTLQAVEYYNGKPIYYSLGDLWCGSDPGESAVAKIILAADGSVRAEIIPCVNVGSRTYIATGDAKAAILARLNVSATVSVDENGVITER